MAERPLDTDTIYTIIDYGDSYVQPLLESAIAALGPDTALAAVPSVSDLPFPSSPLLVWAQYESLPFEHASAHPTATLINSYVFRKALIRKHYLATTVRNWLVKHPSSVLGSTVKPGVDFELDYSEFLDDALVECYELNDAMADNEGRDPPVRAWWILKAGLADRGGGIRLFSSLEDLQTIFEGWDPDSDDDDDDEADARRGDDADDAIVISQMRHFVAQPYVDPPLLLQAPFESAGRKFHIRTYVVAVGALRVYVYREMLALFAGSEYCPPWEAEDPNAQLDGHLTNTCRQNGERKGSVHAFWSLPPDASDLAPDWKERAYKQICESTGELYEAAARGMMMHFQPLPNAFEIYGLDFLLDASGNAWLLEVNAFPDFAQTGEDLSEVIGGLITGVVDLAVRPFFGGEEARCPDSFTKVLDVDLGRR